MAGPQLDSCCMLERLSRISLSASLSPLYQTSMCRLVFQGHSKCFSLILCVSFALLAFLPWLQKRPTPAFLAVALPWLLAGSMKASWVTYALITVAAFKAHSAPDAQNKQIVLIRKSILKVISTTANNVNMRWTYLHSPGFSQKPCSSLHPGRQIAVRRTKHLR